MQINRYQLVTEMMRQELSVADLAAKAGVSKATVTSLRGGKSCSANTIAHVARALGVSVDYLRKEEKHGASASVAQGREHIGDRPAV